MMSKMEPSAMLTVVQAAIETVHVPQMTTPQET